jgi:nicotinate phosphoribosyltransferase
MASGNLDESSIQEIIASGAPIDDFAVGTRLVTSIDAPFLDCVYKLQEYAGRARRKRSEGKATWPGRKQVYRTYGTDGRMEADLLTLVDDPQDGEPLLCPCMVAGKRIAPAPPLSALRERAAAQLALLPEHLQRLKLDPAYPVTIAPALHHLAEQVDLRST